MPSDHVHDPDLLDALEAMETCSFAKFVWRVTWSTRDPLAGGTGGGRWHPPNGFEVLYTSVEKQAAMAEVYSHIAKAPVFSSSHVKIHKLTVVTERTLVFPNVETLRPLGVTEDEFRRSIYTRTREIGSAARFLDFDGLLVPSAKWPSSNLVIFLDRLKNRDALAVQESYDVNWPAWREHIAAKSAATSV